MTDSPPSTPAPSPADTRIGILLGITSAVVLIVALCAVYILRTRHLRRANEVEPETDADLTPTPLPARVDLKLPPKAQVTPAARLEREPAFPRVVISDACSVSAVPVGASDPRSAGIHAAESTHKSATRLADQEEHGSDERLSPVEGSSSAPVVDQLVERLLRVLAQHADNLVRQDEPRGYGTKWWTGEKLAVAADDEEVLLGASQLQGEGFDATDSGYCAELEARRAKRLAQLDDMKKRELAEYGVRPSEAERTAEAERRARVAREATFHCVEAVALLRARSDLLVHRLPLISADEDGALALLAGVIARTPIGGSLDMAPQSAGSFTGFQPFACGTPYARVADPSMLSDAIRQVQVLAAAEEPPKPSRVLGVPPLPATLPNLTSDPMFRPLWDPPSVGSAFEGSMRSHLSELEGSGAEQRAAPPEIRWRSSGEALHRHYYYLDHEDANQPHAEPRREWLAPSGGRRNGNALAALEAYADIGLPDPMMDEGLLSADYGQSQPMIATRGRFDDVPPTTGLAASRRHASEVKQRGGGGARVPTTCVDDEQRGVSRGVTTSASASSVRATPSPARGANAQPSSLVHDRVNLGTTARVGNSTDNTALARLHARPAARAPNQALAQGGASALPQPAPRGGLPPARGAVLGAGLPLPPGAPGGLPPPARSSLPLASGGLGRGQLPPPRP